jgi:hypothetical protein
VNRRGSVTTCLSLPSVTDFRKSSTAGSATRRKLQTMAKALRTTGRVGPTPSLSLKPGARLVREWRGPTHTVTVTEDGFEYAGTSYPSLTKIAKKITGAHWWGPRFFGLPAAAAERPSNGGRHGIAKRRRHAAALDDTWIDFSAYRISRKTISEKWALFERRQQNPSRARWRLRRTWVIMALSRRHWACRSVTSAVTIDDDQDEL